METTWTCRGAVLAAAIAGFSATAAMAADPVDPVHDWSGSYVGLFAGYGTGDIDLRDLDGYNVAPVDGDFEYDADGFIGGVNFGHNWQSGKAVLGLEGEVGYFDYSGSGQFPDYIGVRTPFDSRASIDGGVYGGAFLRLGFALDRLLFYGKGGVVGFDADVSFIDPDPIGTTLVAGTSKSEFLVGYGVGGGLEFAISDNWSFGGEYLFMDFGSISHTATDAGGGANRFRHELEGIHTGRATLKFHW